MKKELKDYAPLYLGCKMQYASHHEPQDELYTLRIDNLQEAIEFGDFLVLRQLNNMTKMEKIIVFDYEMNHDTYADSKVKAVDTWIERMDITRFRKWLPRTFKFLLSKHFDLFGLIECGLAVNATELNNVSSR